MVLRPKAETLRRRPVTAPPPRKDKLAVTASHQGTAQHLHCADCSQSRQLEQMPAAYIWSVSCRPRARALDLVKKHSPEHLVKPNLNTLLPELPCIMRILSQDSCYCLTSLCMLQDTAKKTKWVVELIQGIMGDHEASLEAEKTQHTTQLVRCNMFC